MQQKKKKKFPDQQSRREISISLKESRGDGERGDRKLKMTDRRGHVLDTRKH